jgi:hypothetical protein
MKTQLKRITVPVQLPLLPATFVRNGIVPNQYVDPELLHQALQTLTGARTALLAACDQADMAAKRAGTPLRTQTVRLKIEELTAEVRAIESRIAEASAGEHMKGRDSASGVGRTLATRKRNEIDREFDPRDRSSRFDPVRRSDRDSFKFFHRSLKDPRWYRVASATNQTGSIDPVLFPQVTALVVSKPGKSPKSKSPMGPPVPLTIDEALAKVRDLLKEGGWGEDRLMNGELKTLVKLFLSLGSATANAVIAKLTDAELKLIADDMDSSGIGNYDGLSSSEKEAFIADLAMKIDATQFARIAVAFDDPEQIAKVLSGAKGSWPAKQGFLEYATSLLKVDGDKADPLATQSLSLSIAAVLASLLPSQLAFAINSLASHPGLLDLVFRIASRMTEKAYPEGIESTVAFHPALLLKINEIALNLPANSAERCAIYVSTITTLKWMNNMSTSRVDPAIKLVLFSATKLLGSNPVAFMGSFKHESSSYVEWLTELIELHVAKPTIELLMNFQKGSNKPDDLWMLGYVTGVLLRAQHNVEQRLEERIAFAVGVVGALLNALPTGGQVLGAVALEIEEGIRNDMKSGMNEAAVIFKAVTKRLGDQTDLLDKFGGGYLNALGPTIQTYE